MIQPVDVASGVWRGSRPSTAADWQTLKDLGVKRVLDLETGARWFGDGYPLADALVANRFDIRVYAHPLGTILPPSRNELVAAVLFMNAQWPVYVHCLEGRDRTGMVCAAYRMWAQGWSFGRAVGEMIDEGGMHPWYWYWIPRLLCKRPYYP